MDDTYFVPQDGFVIYALLDPRNDEIRYVGLTKNIAMRFSFHMREAGNNTSKGIWLGDLQRHSLQPIVKILETLGPQRNLAEDREKFWIRSLEQSGCSY
ncbi:hypothetical protein KSD_43680 [Ktedonobacter sp. SOSP1-85]|uniref:GIY-YIG nuclease family protein n=1 Tax=Ktedonobacter sp. SOSP1-85 TaxID=2778367 RepID=UPI001915227E|nr:GIY-YIG nuclease family protein [Ktedonobacter sp. SOSP1-85]GHO76597.1 hypothetical protein KSD_43680 [Ktedonobacter sp. SOSP1-85]